MSKQCESGDTKMKAKTMVPQHWLQNGVLPWKYLVRLSPSCLEYTSVKEQVLKIEGIYDIDVARIQNPEIYCSFKFRELEYQSRGIKYEVMELMQGIDCKNVIHISRNNMDWRTGRNNGVYFTSCPVFANEKYKSQNDRRAILLSDVIVGRKCLAGYGTTVPPEGYDTTCNRDGKVYVKYNDDEFYPKYVIYYNIWNSACSQIPMPLATNNEKINITVNHIHRVENGRVIKKTKKTFPFPPNAANNLMDYVISESIGLQSGSNIVAHNNSYINALNIAVNALSSMPNYNIPDALNPNINLINYNNVHNPNVFLHPNTYFFPQ